MRKQRRVQPTELQKRLFNELAKQKIMNPNKNPNKRKAMKDAGYSDSMASSAITTIDSRGFQELLAQQLPETTLVDYLRRDLELKEGNRLGELKLAFDLKGFTTNKAEINIHNEGDAELIRMRQLIDSLSQRKDGE